MNASASTLTQPCSDEHRASLSLATLTTATHFIAMTSIIGQSGSPKMNKSTINLTAEDMSR